jgi:hypothetical protein
MTQIMNLLHLAPDIQEDVLFLPTITEGRDPVTETNLRVIVDSSYWKAQRILWRSLFDHKRRGCMSSCSAAPQVVQRGVQ